MFVRRIIPVSNFFPIFSMAKEAEESETTEKSTGVILSELERARREKAFFPAVLARARS